MEGGSVIVSKHFRKRIKAIRRGQTDRDKGGGPCVWGESGLIINTEHIEVMGQVGKTMEGH